MCIQKRILNSTIIANIEVYFIQMQCVIEALRWMFTLYGAILANSNLCKKDHFQRNTNQSYISI